MRRKVEKVGGGDFSPFPNLPFFLSHIIGHPHLPPFPHSSSFFLIFIFTSSFSFFVLLPLTSSCHFSPSSSTAFSFSCSSHFSLLPLLVVYLQSSFPLSPFFIFILPFPVVFAFFTSSPPFFFFFFFFCFISFPCFPFPALLPSTVSLFHPLVLQLLVMSSSSSLVLLRVPWILHLPCFPLFPFHFCCFSFPKIFFSPSACF